MRLALKILTSSTLWVSIGLVGGFMIGKSAGYSRGAYDVMGLVIELRSDPPTPPRFTKGDI